MTENAKALPSIPERRYERPPIVEALCEIYFTGSQWDVTVPGIFYERVRADYPQKSQLVVSRVELPLGPEIKESQSLPIEQRVRFTRTDGSRLIQLARDLLVVNQLLPYPHYEEWREVVHTTLDLYTKVAAPSGIVRVGVRYINRVHVPGARIRVEDYFRVYPEIPEELGGTHGPFMLQLRMQPVCPHHELTLTIGTAPPESPSVMSYLLDIYDIVPLKDTNAFGQLSHLLDEAHANIVHTFEYTITEKARSLFGEATHE